MIILVHVLVAIASVISTSVLFFVPSKRNFMITYSLIGLTFISGTYLIISMPTHLVSDCESGLSYIGVVLFGLIVARVRAVRSEAYSSKIHREK